MNMTMKLLGQGARNLAGTGSATRGIVRERAVELAEIDGRTAQSVLKSDWEQAKRELTVRPGEDEDPNEALLDPATASDAAPLKTGSAEYSLPMASTDNE